MNTTEIRCTKLSQLDQIAAEILSQYPAKRIFVLSGAMGAGKTTFIQAICRQLHVTDVVNSPTFSIVNEYLTESGKSVFHFDLFRIRNSMELMDIGYEEYFFSGEYCLIEWPEMAEDLIPGEAVAIGIRVDDKDQARIFSVGTFQGIS